MKSPSGESSLLDALAATLNCTGATASGWRYWSRTDRPPGGTETDMRIPFNRPYMTGRELEYIAQAHARLHLAGNGVFTGHCQDWLRERLGCREVAKK